MRWTVAVVIVGLVLVGGVAIALGGGIIDTPWSGDSGESDEGEPNGGDDTAGSEPPDNGDDESGEENETDEGEPDSEVRIETYARSVGEGNELDSGTLTLTAADGEDVLTHDISEESALTVEELSPAETYVVNVTDPNDGRLPPGTEQFDAGETDTVEVVAGYEIRGAESHRNIYKQNSSGISFSAAEGVYAENGDAFRRLTNDPFFWESSGIQFDLYTDGETNRAFGYTRSTEEWEEGDHFSLTDPLPATPQLIQEPYQRNSPDEWQYIREHTITKSAVFTTFKDENPALKHHLGYISEFEDEFSGITVHVYNLSSDWSEEYDNEVVYVDVNTGYIVRYEYDRYRDGDFEQVEQWVYESFAHDEVSSVDEYNLEEITN